MLNKLKWTLAAAAASAIWSSMPAMAATDWDYYAFTGVTHPVTLLLDGFADEVKKRTHGELVIHVHPAGELPFKATEVVKIVGDGQVQLGSASPGFVGSAIPMATVGNHVGLIRTYADMAKVWPIIEKHTEPLFEKAGAKILFHWNWPTQQVFETKSAAPIQKLSDFSGRKIRTVAPQENVMLERLGAAPIALTTPEVPVALERGVADGLISAAFNVVGSQWQEFLGSVWVSNLHIGGPNYEIVNKQAYDALDPSVRKTLNEVAAEWSNKMNKEIGSRDDADLKSLGDKYGLKLVQASPEDISALTAKMQDYWDSWAAKQGPDGTAMMKEIRAALGR
jgi:TRAP-type C4-dicarboxylate transport system substrate-binding protein